MSRTLRSLALSSFLPLAAAAIVACGFARSSGGESNAGGSSPRPGEAAPGFTLQTSTGSTASLQEYKGKSKVVLMFYRGYW